MARVFISHSSRDNEQAARIKAWLAEHGFETPFLDYDKHSGIPPGADWEKTLYREIERSEAMVIIQTANWLESKWCFAEFTGARALGKPIFPIIEAPTGDTFIARDIQALDLRLDREGGLEQLSRQLTQIALDAQGGFSWDASRPPYPGLLAFQEEDAPLYFGRDDDIRRLIERLNARRAQGGAKLVALLGASGSGKSSLLRAGVIPRIKRSGRNWIVLPTMRPQVRPVDELARCLAVACGGIRDWRTLRDELGSGDLALILGDIANDLRVKAAANEAQILLPIDQAEELFGASNPGQTLRFFEILSAALTNNLPFIAVMAMRSDFLGLLQSAEGLTARFEEFSLSPMALARIPQIIEGPARVAGLGIDEAFVQQAALDAETEDALPLLAFALRELYDRASDDNYLSLEEYLALGDPTHNLSPLENAVRRSADEVLRTAGASDEVLVALREAFVPNMVRVNDLGEYVRQPARWDELPAKAHPLLESLANARLLIIRQEDGHKIVEVAHEALLRKWPRLRGWLDEARNFLTGKQQLEVDLVDWQQAGEADKEKALLTGLKLSRAQNWLTDRPHQLTRDERAFIQASIDQQTAGEHKKARQRRLIMSGSLAATVVLAIAFAISLKLYRDAQDANQQAQSAFQIRAEEQIDFVWMDLDAKEKEKARLTEVSYLLGVEPEQVLAQDWSIVHEDGFDCDTRLTSGFRALYCSVRNVVGFKKLESISGLTIFRPGGPHNGEINYRAAEFGRYNPEFLDWAESFITRDYSGNPLLEEATRHVYETNLKSLARALYHSYQIIYASADDFEAFTNHYYLTQDYYQDLLNRRVTNLGRFYSDTTFSSMDGQNYIRSSQQDTPVAMGSVQSLENGSAPSYWAASYLPTAMNDDDYLSDTAPGFWARRDYDGTREQIFSIVTKVIEKFEPEYFADNCLWKLIRSDLPTAQLLRERSNGTDCGFI